MEFKQNKISKNDFLKISEENVMFITNPGRMGDEDGVTFILKQNNEFKKYRIDGLMYRRNNDNNNITIEDISKQFPKWKETWKNNSNNKYTGKYKYIYMGFGNGLSVDNRIYNIYKPYLDKKVQEYLMNKDNKEDLEYAAIYNTWEEAFIDMINNKRRV